MSKKVRKIINIILVLALAVTLSIYGRSFVENLRANKIYGDVKELAMGTAADSDASEDDSAEKADTEEDEAIKNFTFTDPYVKTLTAIDLKALQEVNPEVKGWISIPDTVIDFPIMQHEDNEYYLDYTWDNVKNIAGAIFFDSENAADMSDFNTLIYGHNMRNGTMFSVLEKYFRKNFLAEHPSIYVVTEGGVYKYNVYAAHRTEISTISFGMQIHTEPMRQEYIDFALDYSEIETDIIPTTEDSFLTLATCSYSQSYRVVIQAVLDKEASYIRE